MKASVDCIPCVFLQALNASRRITTDEEKLLAIQHELMQLLPSFSLDTTPAELSYYALNEAYKRFDAVDPYAEDKRRTNEMMLALYPKMEKIAEYSTDMQHTALKMAAAGNIIDLGIKIDFDVSAMITKVLDESFRVDDYRELMEDIKASKNILYLADNAGEIVGDKLFIKSLDRKDIIVAVKEKPILNDATIDDAYKTGIDEVAKVMSTGSGMLGTILSDCSKEFIEVYNNAELIISKGQANYESLDEVKKNIYFVLTAKCDLIARNLGVNLNDAVVMKGKGGKKKNQQNQTPKAGKK